MHALLLIALVSLLTPLAYSAPPPSPGGAQIKVVAVSASSALPKFQSYTFDAANLIDGRVDTGWQPAKKDTMGVGQWVELDLGAPHQISSVEIEQGLQKVDPKLGDLFCRNNRLAGATLYFDDGTYAPVWAAPGEVSLKVTGFYRGESLPGREVKTVTRFIRLVVYAVQEPVDWNDLGIAEIRVFGRAVDALPVDATSIACDRPGAWPFKTAVIDFCAVNVATRGKRDCAGLVLAFAECRSHDRGPPVPLPAMLVDDIAKGRVAQTLAIDGARHTLEFVRGTDGRWSVTRHTRLDAAGKAAAPKSEQLVEEDNNGQNPCFEKLGKERAPRDPPTPGEYPE